MVQGIAEEGACALARGRSIIPRTAALSGLLGRARGPVRLLLAAVGRPRFVCAAWSRPGAVVVDAGYNAGNVGDVNHQEVTGVARSSRPCRVAWVR